MSDLNRQPESTLFIRDRGIWRRFFAMLLKSRLPFLWIAGYIAISMLIVNLGVSVTEYTSEMFAGNLSFQGVILPFILYSGINLITGFISTVVAYFCRARIDRNLRCMVWDKITRLPMGYFDRNKPKELLTRITTDTTVISSLVVLTVIPFFTGLYNLYVMFAKVGSYDATLMWSLLLVVPFVLCSGFMMGKMKFGVNDTVNRKTAELARDVSEKMTGISLIKANAAEEKETEAGAFRMKDLFRASIQASWVNNLISPVSTIVGCLQLVMIVLVGRAFYQNGAISLTQWIAYLAFAQQVANLLQSYSGYWTSFKAAQGATRRVTYVMEEQNETKGTDKSAEDMHGAFEVKDVSFSYGETPVLKHALENMMANKTVVMVAHDYQTASHADYVVVFNHGQIEDAGTQEELFKRNAFFRQLVNAEAEEA